MSSRRLLVSRRKGEMVVSMCGGVSSGGGGVWLVSVRAHGSGALAAADDLLVRACVVEEWKYHAGAVKEMGVVLG